MVMFNSIEIPYGNTMAPGAYAECLSVNHHEVSNQEAFNIVGR